MAKIIELIYTEKRTGTGKEESPMRLVKQLWTKDGELVASHDPYTGESSFKSLSCNCYGNSGCSLCAKMEPTPIGA
jgi:hypothetical protein